MKAQFTGSNVVSQARLAAAMMHTEFRRGHVIYVWARGARGTPRRRAAASSSVYIGRGGPRERDRRRTAAAMDVHMTTRMYVHSPRGPGPAGCTCEPFLSFA